MWIFIWLRSLNAELGSKSTATYFFNVITNQL